jgi:hypothetical protein
MMNDPCTISRCWSCRAAPILGLLLLLAGGCNGYSTVGGEPVGGYQWRSLYREDVRTVAVPIFASKDFRRGLEFSLTQAVIKQIESKSPYKVVPREKADTILEGEIEKVSLQTMSQDPVTAVPQENLYSVLVNFTWRDLRTGKIYTHRENFEETVEYYPTLAEGESIASQDALERLALAIVQEIQADW